MEKECEHEFKHHESTVKQNAAFGHVKQPRITIYCTKCGKVTRDAMIDDLGHTHQSI